MAWLIPLLPPLIPQVSELVQFLLVKDQKKIPIKRAGKGENLGSQSLTALTP